ncbi:glycosyltransferase [Vibrio sp. LaRot3]|uniref:glycosyltransferase n=1 Tax=Vibrio sp. LaRot3 TaxID=2998829 RepID=UPI0022CDE88C|nr:glycosyltransferase [Vibrio sp. LaRot3]MDA0147608.1 glycosyltransferase [Vibrio sp. LaRot3]
MSNPTPILFVHYGEDWIRGSERCLLDLIQHLDTDRYHAIVWTNNPSLHKELTFHGVACLLETFPLLLGWNKPRYNVLAWARLVFTARKIIRKHNIGLIHVNSAAPNQWMSLAARITSTPLVTHLHSDYPARDRVTHALHLSPHVITASRAISEQLIDEGYNEKRLSVVHNGLNIQKLQDTPAIDVKQQLKLDDNSTLFVTVGSLIYRKGIDRIFQALCYLRLEHPNCYLVVIGDGEEKQHLQQQVTQLGLVDNVHFVGEQNNVIGWLKGCDAFVSGAREEAFGLAIAEAGLAGIPIIAPFVGGVPEFITHAKTGFLYSNHGYMNMMKMMATVITHPDHCQHIARQGQNHIEHKLSIQHYVSGIERVYQQLMVQQRQPPALSHVFRPVPKALKRIQRNIGGHHG